MIMGHGESGFLDPSERRLQAEKKWGLSSSDHYFLIILGPERTVDAEQSGSRAELAPVLHDTHSLTSHEPFTRKKCRPRQKDMLKIGLSTA